MFIEGALVKHYSSSPHYLIIPVSFYSSGGSYKTSNEIMRSAFQEIERWCNINMCIRVSLISREVCFEMDNIRKACCIGTGTMGSSITLALALGGMKVTIYGRSEESVKRGLTSIDVFCGNLEKAGFMDSRKIRDVRERISSCTSIKKALDGVSFVSEAVSEDLELKQDLFASIESMVQDTSILSSTTSGMDPARISLKMQRRERFLVAHFSNPAHLMPFVELVPCPLTSKETMDLTGQLLEGCGLRPVPLDRYVPGFVFNRLQFALLREAMDLVEKGVVSAEDVDAAVTHGLGRRLACTGPLRSADMGGLDVFEKIASYLLKDLCNSSEVSKILEEPVKSGNYGTKTGSGIFEWTEEEIEKIRKDRESILIDFM